MFVSSAILATQGSRTLTFAVCPSISTELCLVESHIDFTVQFLKIGFGRKWWPADSALSIQSFDLVWCDDICKKLASVMLAIAYGLVSLALAAHAPKIFYATQGILLCKN